MIMKKIAAILMILSVGFVYAQNDTKTKYEQKGDLVEATIYYDNGQIEQHGFFKDKKLHGTWTYFNTAGEKVSLGSYVNGVKTGKWLFKNKEGVKEVNYIDGKVVKVTELADTSIAFN